MDTKCRHLGCGKVIVERIPGRRGRPRLYCPTHQDRSSRGYWSNRQRDYDRCSHCHKMDELRWGGGEFCSAYCYGIGMQVAQGIPLREAESAVAATIAANPSLVSRKLAKKPESALWCPKCGREKVCAYWCMSRAKERAIIGNLRHDMPGVSVWQRHSSLSGHLGPQSATDPIVKASHPWFGANPEWWARPSRITWNGLTLPLKIVTFLNLAHLASEALWAREPLAA